MSMRNNRLALIAIASLVTPPVVAETLLYEDFQDGNSEGWQAFGAGSLSITEYQGNASLRIAGAGVAVRQVSLRDITRIRIGASFAASGLERGDACIGEVTVDDGETWHEFLKVVDGQDDSVTLHTGVESYDLPAGTTRVWFRARVAGGSGADICWLDNVYIVGQEASADADQPPHRQTLTRAFLLGDAALEEPVSMHEFAMPATANEPQHLLSGSLRLNTTGSRRGFRVVRDDWDRLGKVGDAIGHLPEFNFEFVQRGSDIVPLQRGVQRRDHPYWEIILQPGKAWNEAGDEDWTRVSVPFSLVERSANCTHNGVLTWLFRASEISRVAYQISSETCGYLEFDLWGVVAAEYEAREIGVAADPLFRRLAIHRQSRLPLKPLSALASDYPGTEPLAFGIDDGIHPDAMTVYGIVVDGVNYRSDCRTRQGLYPFCDSLPLPSYSTAKSIFAAIATMRLEKLYPGTSQTMIASLIGECDQQRWGNVSIENALDMASGNFRSARPGKDEDSAAHRRFIFSDNHADKLDFACGYFKRKARPGTRFVYHTSDTYLVGTALQAIVRRRQGPDTDLYRSILVKPVWHALHLSPLLDDTKRTYDQVAQPFFGYGLTLEADDILRLASWLGNEGAQLNGEAMLDNALLDASLQRIDSDRGLQAGAENLRYNNGFWAFDAGPSVGCESSAWVPFMSGVSGITVAMFPNGVIYYYFSDSYVFRWQSAREAAHTIRALCQ